MTRAGRYLPPVVWMAAIFLFSTSLFASSQTGSVLEALVRAFYPSVSDKFLDIAHFMVRKSAHFTEYAVLAALWQRALARGRPEKFNRMALISFAICAAYAASDEFHQSFVPSRSASVVDVLIDAAGAVFALSLMHSAIKKRAVKTARA